MTKVLESNENHFLAKENEELKRDVKSLHRRIRLLRLALKTITSLQSVTVAYLTSQDALKADLKLSRLAIQVKKMMRRPIGSPKLVSPQVKS